MELELICKNARAASQSLLPFYEELINRALSEISKSLTENRKLIFAENEKDISAAKQNGIREIMVDRLRITDKTIDSMVSSIMELVELSSPVNETEYEKVLSNGLTVVRKRVPFGVIGIIYESRPNVTVDAAAITLKAGSAVILRGGKEAVNSNRILVKLMREALERTGINPDCIQLIDDPSRELAMQFMKMDEYVDLLIPRGGKSLINSVTQNATVPVIRTGEGNCHIYCDEGCDINEAVKIIINAKTQRPSVCNAAESLVIHKKAAKDILPLLKKEFDKRNVLIRGCEGTRKIIDCEPADETDYYTEYLDLIISCIIVDSLDEAIDHINIHSTHHSEAIITDNKDHAEKFMNKVDSAAVYFNASTRFTDGNQFGLGAEIGISNQKLHARGPMSLKEITTTKYFIYGEGQIRE